MILQVHHATLRVADLDEARERWARLYCLTPTEGGGESALLCTAYEDFCLELRPGFPSTMLQCGSSQKVGTPRRSTCRCGGGACA